MKIARHFCLIAAAFCLFVGTSQAADRKSFESDGVTISYLEAGQGEPVILIHGFIANAQLNWVAPGVFDALAKDYHVIALDNRGHGLSGKPHEPSAYGSQMAKDVVNLMDHLGIEKSHVAGYSLGGFITTHLIGKYPDRLLSAAPCGAGWAPPGDGREVLSDAIAESLESGNGITPLMEALTPSGRPKPSKEQMDQMNKMIMAMNDPLALAAVARGIKDLAVTAAELQASHVPVHSIIGEIDPLKATVDAMQTALSDMTVTVIAGADHMGAFSAPEFIPALQAHIAAHSPNAHTKAPASAERTTAAAQ